MLDMFERAANWADSRLVDYSIYRDCDEWCMQVKLADSAGSFSGFYTFPNTSVDGALEKQLDKLCAFLRKKRLKQSTKTLLQAA